MLGGLSGVPIHKSGVNVDIAPGLIQLGGDGGRVTTLDMGILSLPLAPPLQPYLSISTTTPYHTTPYHNHTIHIILRHTILAYHNLSCHIVKFPD